MNTRSISGGALCIAMGVVLPIAFHLVGLGKVFLPMHIPVFLAGLLFGPRIGFITGVVSPVLSSLLTGMPPLMPPIAQVMVFELGTYGLFAGILRPYFSSSVIPLAASMLAGRVIAGVAGWALLPFFGLPGFSLFYPLTVSLVAGLPGVILQLLAIPALVYLLERSLLPSTRHAVGSTHNEK